MSDVTRILSQIESGDPAAAEQLLPLVYNELRKLAVAKLAHEKPGQTLQATALVHEAYLRLVGVEKAQKWDSRGHFFAAAAEAMRRILIERARHKPSLKGGGGHERVALDAAVPAVLPMACDDLLGLDEAIRKLEQQDIQLLLGDRAEAQEQSRQMVNCIRCVGPAALGAIEKRRCVRHLSGLARP